MPRTFSRRFYLLTLLLAVGVPLCAVLVMAQGQRRAQAPAAPATPFQAATRAFIEGRYAEVDTLTAKLDLRDPNVVALRARAAIERGMYADAETALQAAASRAPASEAALELGLLQQMLSRPMARATLSRVAALAESSRDASELARAGRALQALGQFQEANAAFRDAAGRRARERGHPDRVGRPVPGEIQQGRSAEVLPGGARRSIPDLAPALLGARARARRRKPAAGRDARQARARDQSDRRSTRTSSSPIRRSTPSKRDEARELLNKALAINPSSLDAQRALAALAYVEDKPQEFEAEVAKVLAISPNYGDVYRVAGELAAHNYRFDEAVALTRKGLTLDAERPARARRPRRATAAHRRRARGARRRSKPRSRSIRYDVVTFNLLSMLDTLDKFETIRDGDLIVKLSKDEAPVLKEYAVRARAPGARRDWRRKYEFTPKGPILIEMFPKHDDFAVRTLGLPGMIGALGACFGRVVTLDSPKARPPGDFQWEATLWHELAPRHHAADVESARAAMADRRHFRIRGEARARRNGRRQMDLTFASLLNRDETIKLKDLNAAFQDPKLIGIAYYQASLVVDHLVTTFGQTRPEQAGARVRRRPRHRHCAQGSARHRLR